MKTLFDTHFHSECIPLNWICRSNTSLIPELCSGGFDELTEILTKVDWKSVAAVTLDDELATLNSAGMLEWQRPTRLYTHDRVGPMYRVESQHVDLLVKPSTALLACKTTTKAGRRLEWPEFQQVPAIVMGNCSHAYLKRIPIDVVGINGTPLGALLGFAIGDGSSGGIRSVHFHLRRPRKIEWLEVTCSQLGWKLTSNIRRDEYRVAIPLEHQQLFHSIYDCHREKVIPHHVLDHWPLEGLRGLLDGLLASDGCRTDTGDIYDTTSPVLAGQIQRLAMQLGVAANISQADCYRIRKHSHGKKPIYRLSFPVRCLRPVVNKFAGHLGRSYIIPHWQGRLYCPMVPNFCIYLRRNGKPVWCGTTRTYVLRCSDYNTASPPMQSMPRHPSK